MNLYLTSKGEVFGPYSESEVRSMVTSGSQPRDVLVCREGQNDWHPFNERQRALAPSAPLPQGDPGERVFYKGPGVTVTGPRFIVGQQTYVMRNITSVKPYRVEPPRAVGVILVAIGVIFLLGGLSGGLDLVAITIFGLLLGGIGVAILLTQKAKYSVSLTTAGGEVRALESTDRKFITEIVDALNAAIVGHQ